MIYRTKGGKNDILSEESTKMSFTDKIVGILSSPGEVYTYVAKSVEEKSNWVIPFVSAILISVIFTFVVFKQPAIQSEMQDADRKSTRLNSSHSDRSRMPSSA